MSICGPGNSAVFAVGVGLGRAFAVGVGLGRDGVVGVDVGGGGGVSCVEQPEMIKAANTKMMATTCFVDIAFSCLPKTKPTVTLHPDGQSHQLSF